MKALLRKAICIFKIKLIYKKKQHFKSLVTANGMKQLTAITILTKLKPLLAEKYGVTTLCLFGSTARDEATEHSDVDILVGFARPATSESYFGVQFLLEDQLGCPVDLVTEKALRAELKPHILKDAIHV